MVVILIGEISYAFSYPTLLFLCLVTTQARSCHSQVVIDALKTDDNTIILYFLGAEICTDSTHYITHQTKGRLIGNFM